MAVTIDGAGPLAGATTLNGLTIPTTGFGKVLQVVRATDTTNRSTTSTSFVDVTGMSVTITPQKITSIVLVIATGRLNSSRAAAADTSVHLQITDSSNIGLSGARDTLFGDFPANRVFNVGFNIIGYEVPGTLSPVAYKLRMRSENTAITTTCQNTYQDGQLYAIEVSA